MASPRRLTAILVADVAGYSVLWVRKEKAVGGQDISQERSMTRSGFVAMIVGSGLALAQLAALGISGPLAGLEKGKSIAAVR